MLFFSNRITCGTCTLGILASQEGAPWWRNAEKSFPVIGQLPFQYDNQTSRRVVGIEDDASDYMEKDIKVKYLRGS